jgi:hypothetical protein
LLIFPECAKKGAVGICIPIVPIYFPLSLFTIGTVNAILNILSIPLNPSEKTGFRVFLVSCI